MPTHGDDGGPAFPTGDGYKIDDISMCTIHGGMSLRDWFAGQVLAGITTTLAGKLREEDMIKAAKIAYNQADAMIIERTRRSDDN